MGLNVGSSLSFNPGLYVEWLEGSLLAEFYILKRPTSVQCANSEVRGDTGT